MRITAKQAAALAAGRGLAPDTEEQIQAITIQAAAALGFRVLQTSVRVRMVDCPQCHARFRPAYLGYGATPGVPDLLICRDRWPWPVMIGLEMKGPNTEISPAQADLQAAGRILIARTMETALAGLQAAERAMFCRAAGPGEGRG